MDSVFSLEKLAEKLNTHNYYLLCFYILWQVCEFGGNDCIKAPSILDRTTTKYVNRLVQRVDAVYRHLRQRCDLPALPTLPKRSGAQAQEQQHNEKPKLLQQMRELNAQQSQKEQDDHKDQNASLKAATSATTKQQQQQQVRKPMTTTTVPLQGKSGAQSPVGAATVTARTTASDPLKQQLPPPANVRKKRKLIVFELDDMGVPIARVEYH